MDEAVRCHRLCLLRDGRRVAQGAPGALTRELADRALDVTVQEAEHAIAALRNCALVASTTQLGDTVHVLLDPDGVSAEAAARELDGFLAKAGFPDARARVSAPNLEDVFVAVLLGEDIGEAS